MMMHGASLTLVLYTIKRSTSCSGCFTPQKGPLVPTVEKDELTQELSGCGGNGEVPFPPRD